MSVSSASAVILPTTEPITAVQFANCMLKIKPCTAFSITKVVGNEEEYCLVFITISKFWSSGGREEEILHRKNTL